MRQKSGTRKKREKHGSPLPQTEDGALANVSLDTPRGPSGLPNQDQGPRFRSVLDRATVFGRWKETSGKSPLTYMMPPR